VQKGQSYPLTIAPRDGIATFYDADGSGNCGFDKTPADLDVAAMALPEYDDSSSCGACLRVTGEAGKQVTVRVVDSCPPCEKNGVNLDLSASAFAKLADPDTGRIAIRYQLMSCATTGNIAYHFKDGSSKYWTAIQLRNHRLPIAKLEYKRDGTYVEMKRESYNYFVASEGVGEQPSGLALRVTADDGQVLEDTLAGGVRDDATVPGTQQFN
jgi:expansin (peptidoglycan-binding protein)